MLVKAKIGLLTEEIPMDDQDTWMVSCQPPTDEILMNSQDPWMVSTH